MRKIVLNEILLKGYPVQFDCYASKVDRSYCGNQGIGAGSTGCSFALEADEFHLALEKGLDIVM